MTKDYFEFWNLQESVFLTPTDVARGIYIPTAQRKGVERLRMLLESTAAGSLFVLAGPDGSGKTTMARWLYHELSPRSHEVVHITLNAPVSASGWLFDRLARYFGEFPDHGGMTRALSEVAAEERRFLLIVDNAHHLINKRAWEDIIFFHSLENTISPLPFVLLPASMALDGILRSLPEVKALIQFRLPFEPWTVEDGLAYFQFKTRDMGEPNPVLTRDAAVEMIRWSGAVPAAFNTLAENCLMEAAMSNETSITRDTVLAALSWLTPEKAEEPLPRHVSLPPVPGDGESYSGEKDAQPAPPAASIEPDSDEIPLKSLLLNTEDKKTG